MFDIGGAASGAGIGGSFGDFLSGAAGIFGLVDNDASKYINRANQILAQIEDPNFDFRSISPPELQFVAELMPEVYEAVIPEEVKVAQDSPELRQSQLRGLQYLEQVRDQGLPVAERIAAETIQRRAAEGSRISQQSLLRDLAARGRLGGGTEAALRGQANQQAANLARDQGNALAIAALERRTQAAAQSGQLAGQIRGQDIDLSDRQAQSINRFNEFVSGLQTAAAANAAAQRQAANVYNVGTRQRIADQNELARYGAEESDVNRQNQLLQQLFADQLGRATGQVGVLQQRGALEERQAAADQQNIQKLGSGLGSLAGAAIGGLF